MMVSCKFSTADITCRYHTALVVVVIRGGGGRGTGGGLLVVLADCTYVLISHDNFVGLVEV